MPLSSLFSINSSSGQTLLHQKVPSTWTRPLVLTGVSISRKRTCRWSLTNWCSHCFIWIILKLTRVWHKGWVCLWFLWCRLYLKRQTLDVITDVRRRGRLRVKVFVCSVLVYADTPFIFLPFYPTAVSPTHSEKGEEWKWEVADGAASGQRFGAASAEDRDGDQPRYR